MLDPAVSNAPKTKTPLENNNDNNGITASSKTSEMMTAEKEESRGRGQTDSSVTPTTGSSNDPPKEYLKPARAYSVMLFLTLVIFSSSITNGMITTGLPTIASEIGIPPQTMYWPLAVYSLTAGICLIAAGTVADVVGTRRVFLTGTLLLSAFTLGCSLSRTGLQLTMFRAMQGVAMALCLPSSVGVICQAIAPGRLRNLAFACTGLGQPLGFSLGLILAGVFIQTIGWRPGWYLVAGIFLLCFPVGFLVLPRDRLVAPPSLRRLRTHVDGPGAALASACLAMLAVVLVQLSENQDHIRDPAVVGMLSASLALIPAFVWWMHAAAQRGRPVLIPNRLWRRVTFSSVCVMVMMSYAVMQTLELYVTLFFQQVQGLDALQSSVRLLPSLLIGAVLNLTVGLVMHRVSAMWLVFSSSLACAGAPLLMALINPAWPYWYAAFPAQVLHPVCFLWWPWS
jgi:MFS family permease